MKLTTIVFVGVGLVVAASIAVRLMPIDAGAQHVDPAEVSPPSTPNFTLLRGEGALRHRDGPPETAALLADAITMERGQLIAGDLAQGHATYLFRSRVFGFPDLVSIRLSGDDETTRVEIFARALIGTSDWGVNRARVDRLTATLAP